MKQLRLALVVLLILAGTDGLARTEKNGFDLTKSLIPISEILPGGPPRDGIPAIDRPSYQPARETKYLKDTDLVLGLVHNEIARAFPVRILVWHEIVNSEFDGEPVVVTFCPLCGTGLAFSAVVDRKRLDFGVSGLLHNSDLLMYDRQTDSLWSQIPGRAVTGDMAGKELQRLPVVHLPWKEWRRQYPNSEVLSLNTGSDRDYSRDPYAGYDRTERLFFPVSKSDRRYSRKTWVLGLESNGVSKAWPFPELAKTGGKVMDTFAGQPVEIRYDAAQSAASAHDADGNLLPAVRAYWFAWYGFYPDTDVYNAEP
jgi:hypothetical protein